CPAARFARWLRASSMTSSGGCVNCAPSSAISAQRSKTGMPGWHARVPASRHIYSIRWRTNMIVWLIVAMIGAGIQDHEHADVTLRGEAVMGFDQAMTPHHFRLTARV